MKFFNTAGPVDCRDHYCLPPLERLDLATVMPLIGQKKYFVLHAPRQTGKTSALLAFTAYLNREGDYIGLYINVEKGQSAREDVERGIFAFIAEIAQRAREHLGDMFPVRHMKEFMDLRGPDSALNEMLTAWNKTLPKPLILLVDEIDSLVGDTLISALRQIRAGYDRRAVSFPQSVVLCGIRDVRDYRMHFRRENEIITGGSAFNVKAESLRMGNFSRSQIATLVPTLQRGNAYLEAPASRRAYRLRLSCSAMQAALQDSRTRKRGGSRSAVNSLKW